MRQLPILLLISSLILSCSKTKSVLLTDLTENGALYYYEGEPFTGNGFLNWTPEILKEKREFKDGKIRSIKRNFENGNPLDFLTFNEKQDLIYQKRWISKEISIEKKGFENQMIPLESKTKQLKKNQIDSIYQLIPKNIDEDLFKNKTEDEAAKKINEFVTNHNFLKILNKTNLQINRSNDLTYVLSNQNFYANEDQYSKFDNYDYHFVCKTCGEISGVFDVLKGFYLKPTFNFENTVEGFFIENWITTDSGSRKSQSFETYHIEPQERLLRYATRDNYYYDKILNSFYHVNKISEGEYEFFIRPFMNESHMYNNPYKPVYYHFILNYNTGTFEANYHNYDSAIGDKYTLLGTEPQMYVNKFINDSEYDKTVSISKFYNSRFKALLHSDSKNDISNHINSANNLKSSNSETKKRAFEILKKLTSEQNFIDSLYSKEVLDGLSEVINIPEVEVEKEWKALLKSSFKNIKEKQGKEIKWQDIKYLEFEYSTDINYPYTFIDTNSRTKNPISDEWLFFTHKDQKYKIEIKLVKIKNNYIILGFEDIKNI